MKLSDHFNLDELTASQMATRLGINNKPTTETIERLRMTAHSLEQVRAVLGNNPIHISSGYRSPTLNRSIGGSTTSAHCLGFAVDFTCSSFGTPYEICKAIMASTIKYDQLLLEGISKDNRNGKWVHISFDPKFRNEDMTVEFRSGKAIYTRGIA